MGRDPFGIFKEGEVHTISYILMNSIFRVFQQGLKHGVSLYRYADQSRLSSPNTRKYGLSSESLVL